MPIAPPVEGPSDLEAKKYTPPVLIFPLVIIAFIERTVRNVVMVQHSRIKIDKKIPASPTI
jgi:hypothetical protein